MESKVYTIQYTDSDDLMRQAVNILYREYYSAVSSYGEEIKEELIEKIKAGETRDQLADWLPERVGEAADSSQWVIYTYRAKRLLLVSENEDAMEEQMGETGTDEQRAYFAMCADLQDWISRNADFDELIEEHAPASDEDEDDATMEDK